MATQIDLEPYEERMAPLIGLGMDAKTIVTGYLRSDHLDEFVAEVASLMGGYPTRQQLLAAHGGGTDTDADDGSIGDEPNGIG